MDGIDPRLKNWGIALGLMVAALGLLDTIALKGDQVASASIRLQSDTEPGTLQIASPGQPHTVAISTRKRVQGVTEGQTISWQLVAPDGQVVDSGSERVARKKRFFDFVPTQPGEYRLHVEETKLLGRGRGSAQVSVYVNDHRVLAPLLGL